MFSIRTFVRPLAVALTLAVAAIPATAFAETNRPAPTAAKGGAKKGKEKHFPIEAQKFQELVDQRISKAREHMETALEAHHVPDVIKAQIRKDFESGASEVRAAAKRVGTDGTVTKDEAKEVRDLAKSLKEKAREKYLPGARKGKTEKKDKKNV